MVRAVLELQRCVRVRVHTCTRARERDIASPSNVGLVREDRCLSARIQPRACGSHIGPP
jgi:hypothetical protein